MQFFVMGVLPVQSADTAPITKPLCGVAGPLARRENEESEKPTHTQKNE